MSQTPPNPHASSGELVVVAAAAAAAAGEAPADAIEAQTRTMTLKRFMAAYVLIDGCELEEDRMRYKRRIVGEYIARGYRLTQEESAQLQADEEAHVELQRRIAEHVREYMQQIEQLDFAVLEPDRTTWETMSRAPQDNLSRTPFYVIPG
ncbi:hypothetical protein AURDEDRAFT_174134 [Auricularia subglabra TFB-10046 SS5]|nr:hypothetical protein AURDEDRAFT_174134 [Auricularia subglabra TFB-10046 SS5]